MAVAAVSLTSSSSTTSATSHATASVTPTANRLVLAAVVNKIGTAPASTPTCSGNGLTWVQVATVPYNTNASNLHRLTLFRAMGTSPSAGAITFDYAGTTHTSAGWSVIEFSGVNTTGTNGSGAIGLTNTGFADTNVSGTQTIDLGSAPVATSAAYGAWGTSVATAAQITAGTGFTEQHEVNWGSAGNVGTIETEFEAASDQTIDMSMGAAGKWGGIGVELKAPAISLIIPRRSSTLIRT
jgi:hypothetical protein